MKTKLITLVLLAGVSLFAETHWSIGIGIGTPYYTPPPPPPVVAYTPPCPGPKYTWVPGYYYPVGARFVWHGGFWSRPPYAGAYWVAPRYSEHHYYPGYWERRQRHWDRDDDERRGTGIATATTAGSTVTAGSTAGGTGATMIESAAGRAADYPPRGLGIA